MKYVIAAYIIMMFSISHSQGLGTVRDASVLKSRKGTNGVIVHALGRDTSVINSGKIYYWDGGSTS